jgi:superfamily II DNA or RNA helicase
VHSPWPHQVSGVADVHRLIELGERRIVLTSPTRGGKSWMMLKMCQWGFDSLLIANKKILIDQLFEDTEVADLKAGLVASGYAPDVLARVQVASIQTLHKRWKAGQMELPPAQLVIVDEAHNETGPRAVQIVDEYIARGAIVVLVTATPIGINHMATRMVVAGRNSDLRSCGAIVPAQTYAPDEPTLKAFKKQRAAIIELRKEVKETMMEVICGRSIEHFRRLNPTSRPTIAFPPGVADSLWYAQRYSSAGIPSAHIDSNRIWLNGRTLNTNKKGRDALRAASKNGDVTVVFNRFVLREGVTFSWLSHCMFLCTFGTVKAYLQAGGRVLGQYNVDGVPQLSEVTIQDHGGNFWRFDSLNCDRVWSLGKSDRQYQDEHFEEFRGKTKPEPIVCPKCSKVRYRGVVCPGCGYAYKGRTRMVIETNGRLHEVRGDIFRPRRVAEDPTLKDKWVTVVCRCRNAKRTMNQARSLFQRENQGQMPSPDWPFMPSRPSDWYLPAAKLFPPKKKPANVEPRPLFDGTESVLDQFMAAVKGV